MMSLLAILAPLPIMVGLVLLAVRIRTTDPPAEAA
jgi:hypothetical protein